MQADLLYKIALTRIPLVGSVTAKTLVSYCGGAKEVFESPKKELLKIPGIAGKIADSVAHTEALNQAEKELVFLEKFGIEPLFYLDKKYPQRLRQYPDCPTLLYFKGTSDLNQARIISVVGTRQPTDRGKALCEEFIGGLLPYSVLVVSGLAFGIDIASHRRCLELEMETVGVLGHGLGRIYPHDHKQTAMQMCENGGLLSEFTHDTGPDRENFPMRNRIIAGMCDAVVVVETAHRGGSMITADLANSYNKDVFAFPGRASDEKSKGCNELIKTDRARLIESAADLAAELSWELSDAAGKPVQRSLFVDLDPREQRVEELLTANENMGIDQLSLETRLPASEMSSLLLGMEFKGVIRALPGKRYVLVR